MSKREPLPEDTSVKIPEAVRRAAALAEQAYQSQQVVQERQVTPEGNSGVDPVVMENPEGQGQVAEGDFAQGDGQQAQQAPVQQAQAQQAADRAQAEAAATADAQSTDGTWEHKYRSLHGRFMAQTAQITSLSDTVRDLQNVIATMSAAPRQFAPVNIPTERLVSEQEAADYGSDLLDVVGRRAQEVVAPLLKQMQDQNETLRRQLDGVSGVQAQTVQQRLHEVLDKSLPDWQQINSDPNFLSWLGLPDPFSGAIRMDMLKAAYSQGSAHRVLAFFNGFLKEGAVVAPAGRTEPVQQAQVAKKVSLESFAAPGRAKAAAQSPAVSEKPIISRAQIQEFYAEVAAGKWRGRDAAKDQAEAMIFEAQREGRIS